MIGGAAAVALGPSIGRSQERMRRIGTLMGNALNDPETLSRIGVLREALVPLGWVEGRNYRFEQRAANDPERTKSEVNALIGGAPDLVVTSTSRGVAELRRATATIPILFVNVADPVGGGLITSLASSGTNVTGFTAFEYKTAGKWLELLKEIAPGTQRVAFVYGGPEYGVTGGGFYRAAAEAAPSFGLELIPIRTTSATDVESAIEAFARAPNGGLVAAADGGAGNHRGVVIKAAARNRLPAVYPFRYYVTDGGLAAYGVDLRDQYRRAASYVDRILRGTHPKDLPIQAPNKFELLINLKTAKAQGIDIPPVLLTRADEVIE
jgi:putative tryptophan/tyrosine transport system substrate-binding protein